MMPCQRVTHSIVPCNFHCIPSFEQFSPLDCSIDCSRVDSIFRGRVGGGDGTAFWEWCVVPKVRWGTWKTFLLRTKQPSKTYFGPFLVFEPFCVCVEVCVMVCVINSLNGVKIETKMCLFLKFSGTNIQGKLWFKYGNKCQILWKLLIFC